MTESDLLHLCVMNHNRFHQWELMFQQDVGKSFYIPVIDIIQQIVCMWVICCSVKMQQVFIPPCLLWIIISDCRKWGRATSSQCDTVWFDTSTDKDVTTKADCTGRPAALTVCSFVRIRKELHSTEHSLRGVAWEERIPVHTSVTSGCKLWMTHCFGLAGHAPAHLHIFSAVSTGLKTHFMVIQRNLHRKKLKKIKIWQPTGFQVLLWLEMYPGILGKAALPGCLFIWSSQTIMV